MMEARGGGGVSAEGGEVAGEAEDDVRVIWDVRGWGRATERTKERRERER
jgi:hypothetical protein